MKYISTISCFLYFLPLSMFGQKEKEQEMLMPSSRLGCSRSELKIRPRLDSPTLPFSYIQIIDATPENSTIGFMQIVGDNSYFKICFKGGRVDHFTKYINTQFKDALSTTSNDTLLLVIRKMRIAKFDSIPDKILERITFYNAVTDYSRLHFRTEIYLKNQSCYYAITRFDSVLYRRYAPNPNTLDLLEESFIRSTLKASHLVGNDSYNRKCLSFSTIDSFNRINKAYQILLSAIPRKGVYANYKQFLENNPESVEYEIQNHKDGIFLYTKNKNGDPILRTDAWGFLMGKIFMRLRVSHTRCFYGTIVHLKLIFPANS